MSHRKKIQFDEQRVSYVEMCVCVCKRAHISNNRDALVSQGVWSVLYTVNSTTEILLA